MVEPIVYRNWDYHVVWKDLLEYSLRTRHMQCRGDKANAALPLLGKQLLELNGIVHGVL